MPSAEAQEAFKARFPNERAVWSHRSYLTCLRLAALPRLASSATVNSIGITTRQHAGHGRGSAGQDGAERAGSAVAVVVHIGSTSTIILVKVTIAVGRCEHRQRASPDPRGLGQ